MLVFAAHRVSGEEHSSHILEHFKRESYDKNCQVLYPRSLGLSIGQGRGR